MASGLRRTIQTAVTAFAPTLARPEVPLLLVPMAQEISAKPCDTGTDAGDLEKGMDAVLRDVDVKFEHVGRIDYSLLEEGWNGKVYALKPATPLLLIRYTARNLRSLPRSSNTTRSSPATMALQPPRNDNRTRHTRRIYTSFNRGLGWDGAAQGNGV
jgi:hypothetical protein